MKDSVIDIGSNSVRLYIKDTNCGKKYIETTMLAKDMRDGFLHSEAISRTIAAVLKFIEVAKCQGLNDPLVFATEAVRSANNSDDFINQLLTATGIKIQILSCEEEAKVAFLGATDGYNCPCGVIDIGGASVEYAFGTPPTLLYSKSLPIGAIALKNKLGDNRKNINTLIQSELQLLDATKIGSSLIGVGGTLTSLAAMDLNLDVYDPQKVHGHKLTLTRLHRLEKFIFSNQDISKSFITISPQRAEILKQGILIAINYLSYFNKEEITVSEKDNLEGFLLYKKI